MAETIEESYESAVTRKVVRTSLKIEEVSCYVTRRRNSRRRTLTPHMTVNTDVNKTVTVILHSRGRLRTSRARD